MRTHQAALLGMSLLVASYVGCDCDPDPGMDDPTPPDCPDNGVSGAAAPPGFAVIAGDQQCGPNCGQNTPYVHGLRMDGLYVDGTPSDQGFEILSFTAPDGSESDFEVVDGRFRTTLTDGTFVSGLVGGKIEIAWHVPPAAPRRYALHINNLGYVPSWAAHDGRLPVYDIMAQDLLCGGRAPICTTPDGATTHAVLLKERYDAAHTDVLGSEPSWFTVACEGSALYKMRLAGYNPEIPAGEMYFTTPDQRKATLKMITADYCGSGHSYTEVGTELRWQNVAGWCQEGMCPYFPSTSESTKLEAIWGPEGARCLDTPRAVERSEIACESEIPHCNDATLSSLGGEWETRVPVP